MQTTTMNKNNKQEATLCTLNCKTKPHEHSRTAKIAKQKTKYPHGMDENCAQMQNVPHLLSFTTSLRRLRFSSSLCYILLSTTISIASLNLCCTIVKASELFHWRLDALIVYSRRAPKKNTQDKAKKNKNYGASTSASAEG